MSIIPANQNSDTHKSPSKLLIFFQSLMALLALGVAPMIALNWDKVQSKAFYAKNTYLIYLFFVCFFISMGAFRVTPFLREIYKQNKIYFILSFVLPILLLWWLPHLLGGYQVRVIFDEVNDLSVTQGLFYNKTLWAFGQALKGHSAYQFSRGLLHNRPPMGLFLYHMGHVIGAYGPFKALLINVPLMIINLFCMHWFISKRYGSSFGLIAQALLLSFPFVIILTSSVSIDATFLFGVLISLLLALHCVTNPTDSMAASLFTLSLVLMASMRREAVAYSFMLAVIATFFNRRWVSLLLKQPMALFVSGIALVPAALHAVVFSSMSAERFTVRENESFSLSYLASNSKYILNLMIDNFTKDSPVLNHVLILTGLLAIGALALLVLYHALNRRIQSMSFECMILTIFCTNAGIMLMYRYGCYLERIVVSRYWLPAFAMMVLAICVVAGRVCQRWPACKLTVISLTLLLFFAYSPIKTYYQYGLPFQSPTSPRLANLQNIALNLPKNALVLSRFSRAVTVTGRHSLRIGDAKSRWGRRYLRQALSDKTYDGIYVIQYADENLKIQSEDVVEGFNLQPLEYYVFQKGNSVILSELRAK